MNKQCSKCKVIKPIDEFHKNKEMKDGHFAHCKECHHLKAKEWEKNNREKRIAYQAKWTKENPELIKKYQQAYRDRTDKGILKQRRQNWNKNELDKVYGALIPIQNDRCAICEKPFKKRRYIDHNHSNREIRGLLCQFCNVGISYFENVEGFADKTKNYLNNYPAKKVSLRKYWYK